MALFTKDTHGKPISKKLSEYLKVYTCAADRAKVAKRNNVSTSTLRDIIYSGNNISIKNAPGMTDLMKTAIQNGKNSLERAQLFELYCEQIAA